MFIMLMMISLYSLYFGNSIILNNFNYLHDKSSSSIIMSSSSYAEIYIKKLGCRRYRETQYSGLGIRTITTLKTSIVNILYPYDLLPLD